MVEVVTLEPNQPVGPSAAGEEHGRHGGVGTTGHPGQGRCDSTAGVLGQADDG